MRDTFAHPETLPNGLTLFQDERYFKLGQDSVLLSSFASPKNGDRVLDLGCGTGALSLMLYKEGLRITGLEIQEGAVGLFRESIKENAVDIQAINGDLREIRVIFRHGCMDYVICNPPYFVSGSGKASNTDEKRIARQDGSCSLEELAEAAAFVLHPGGRAAFVFRPERLSVFISAMEKRRLIMKRLRFVHQKPSSIPSAALAEFRRDGSAEGLKIEPPLIVESEEYLRIYRGEQ